MTVLHTFDIPEDDVLLPSWLETMIAGPHLGELVSELQVLQEAGQGIGDGRQTTLQEALGGRLEAVCQGGLASVPAPSLRRLFRQPQLLIELQDRVLSEGAAFWDRKLRESDALTAMTEAGWKRLCESPAIRPAAIRTRPAQESRARPLRWFVAGFATAAAAAIVAVVVSNGVQAPMQVAQAGWGWNRADALPQDVSGSQYLRTLADEAEEWKAQAARHAGGFG